MAKITTAEAARIPERLLEKEIKAIEVMDEETIDIDIEIK